MGEIMKQLKMLGLAAIAALALTALAGAGTASAAGGVLCEEEAAEEECKAKWMANSHMTYSLKATTKTRLTSELGATLAECAESKLTAKVLSAGTAAARAKLELKKEWLTFGKCGPEEKDPPPVTVTSGELEFEWRNEAATKGTVFAKNAVIRALIGGVTCHYTTGAGTDLGLYTPGAGGKDGIFAIAAPITRENTVAHPSSTFLCPAKVIWDAEYTLTGITPLFIKGE